MQIKQISKQVVRSIGVCILATVMAYVPHAFGDSAKDKENKQKTSWAGSWSTAPMLPGLFDEPVTPANDKTIRQVVRLSAGGRALRIRLSNVFGTAPLKVSAATVALWDMGPSVLESTLTDVTFGGESEITIPAGARIFSDPINLRARKLSDLVVSIYLPDAATSPDSPVTGHVSALQTAYVLDGNQVNTRDPLVEATNTSYTYLTGVDVLVKRPITVLAALGDSITDGDQSTFEGNQRWPNLLAQRILANDRGGKHRSFRNIGILNLGISGNQMTQSLIGPNAQARFDRDVLTQTGVTHVILLEGINDIGLPAFLNLIGIPAPLVSAEEIIAGYKQLIIRAHARGLKIIGATLTPSAGFIFPGSDYASTIGEEKRQAVNAWIRESGAFDAVVDFDAVLRDPAEQTIMRADLTADGLHPNDAGYQVMADAISLKLLK